jgi:hypothetical protein
VTDRLCNSCQVRRRGDPRGGHCSQPPLNRQRLSAPSAALESAALRSVIGGHAGGAQIAADMVGGNLSSIHNDPRPDRLICARPLVPRASRLSVGGR